MALVGPLADDATVMEGSKQDYRAAHIVSIKEGIETFWKGGGDVRFAAGLSSVTDGNTRSVAYKAAIRTAVGADVAVLVVGIDKSVEAEGKDRPDVALPGAQEQLLKDVAKARVAAGKASGMVVILVNGGPISCDWLRETDAQIAVLEAFEGGQSAGTALAETLFGDNNPSGVLPYTLFAQNATVESVVPFARFDMRPDGPYPGRTYRFSRAPVLWPFGAGLSYTTFALSWSGSAPEKASTRDVHRGIVRHTVKVTNTGKVAGAKVVQAFVTRHTGMRHRALGAPPPPIKELYGMHKVFLAPGASQEITFGTVPLPGPKPFATTLPDGTKAIVPGDVTITVGLGIGKLSHAFEMVGEVLPL